MSKVFNPNAASFGLYGHAWVTDDTYSDKQFYCLQAMTDATVTYTDTAIDTGAAVTHTGQTLPAGLALFGNITNVNVTNGTLVAYYKAAER